MVTYEYPDLATPAPKDLQLIRRFATMGSDRVEPAAENDAQRLEEDMTRREHALNRREDEVNRFEDQMNRRQDQANRVKLEETVQDMELQGRPVASVSEYRRLMVASLSHAGASASPCGASVQCNASLTGVVHINKERAAIKP